MQKISKAGLVMSLALMGSVVSAEETSSQETVNAEATFTGDFEAGEKLYKKECRGCHGPTAKGLASYPKLRGNPPEYLVDKLERYRAGQKIGPNTPLMAPRAKKLSDEDINNIVFFIVTKFPD